MLLLVSFIFFVFYSSIKYMRLIVDKNAIVSGFVEKTHRNLAIVLSLMLMLMAFGIFRALLPAYLAWRRKTNIILTKAGISVPRGLLWRYILVSYADISEVRFRYSADVGRDLIIYMRSGRKIAITPEYFSSGKAFEDFRSELELRIHPTT